MVTRKVLVALFWILVTLAPLFITALVLGTLPEGTEQIPMQVGFNGEISRWGSPSELWLIGGIMGGCNLLMCLSYYFINPLFAMGLVNGVKSTHSARIILMVVAVVLVATTLWSYWFLLGLI